MDKNKLSMNPNFHKRSKFNKSVDFLFGSWNTPIIEVVIAMALK